MFGSCFRTLAVILLQIFILAIVSRGYQIASAVIDQRGCFVLNTFFK